MAEQDEPLTMTDRTRKGVRLAAAFSQQRGHEEVEPEDLLDALAHYGGISDFVLVERGYVRKEAPPIPDNAARWCRESKRFQTLLAEAHQQARAIGCDYLGEEHLLLAVAVSHPDLLPDYEALRTRVVEVLYWGIEER